jgi:hypothetical protein
MRTLRLALAGVLTALGLVVLTDAPSYACSCVGGTTAQHLRWSDAAFTGTLADIEEPPPSRIISSTDPVTYRFEVDRVFEGDVPAEVEVVSARFGASCGLVGMRVGTEYVVYATAGRDGFESGLCTGTAPVRGPVVDRLAELTLGPARAAFAAILAFLGITPP